MNVQHSNHRPPFEDPLDLVPWALSKLYTLWLRLTYPFAFMGCGVSVHYTFKANRVMAPRIKLGNSVTAGKDVWLNIIPEATDEVNIVIEDNCHVGPRTWISAKNQIHLERDVRLGSSVLIQDHGHVYENPDLPVSKQPAMEGGRIRIERGCQIGQGVAIVCSRGELVLGQHCVVMPNSVVIRSTPSYCVVGGNPARVLERLDSSQTNPESPSCTIGEVVKANSLDHLPQTSRTLTHHGRAE
jgi:acetyltransferase-like isoleucine patch superfamily enzyme